MQGLRRTTLRFCAIALAVLLSLTTITACGEDDDDGSATDDTTEVACQLGAFALGLVVTAVTHGRSGDEIGDFVSSQGGGELLSNACELWAADLENQPAQQFTFDLELPTGAVEQQSVFGTDLLEPPPPAPEPSLLDCFDWESDFLFQLCIEGVIDPPIQ